MHRITIGEPKHDCTRVVRMPNGRMFNLPHHEATSAVDRAAAAVALQIAGLDYTPEQALEDDFDTDGDLDAYYNAVHNLMEGAEDWILEELVEKYDAEEWYDWHCHECGSEWSGPDHNGDCYSCELDAKELDT